MVVALARMATPVSTTMPAGQYYDALSSSAMETDRPAIVLGVVFAIFAFVVPSL
ncbi:MAG: hypothetical protein ACYS0K_10415 [Planctomycetota bacterium]